MLSILSFSLLGRAQNVPEIMCKTVGLPQVLKILARKCRMKTMNVFDFSKYLITAVLQIIGLMLCVSSCSNCGAAVKRPSGRVGTSGALYLEGSTFSSFCLKFRF